MKAWAQPTVHPRVVALLASLLALHALLAVLEVGGGSVMSPERALYAVLMAAAAGLCAVRAVAVRRERLPWAVLASALALWTAGEYAWAALESMGPPPVPSVADALWLAYYPAAYLGLALLIRARLREVRAGMWLDGLVAGLAAAGVGAAVLLGAVREGVGGGTVEVATYLAYPIGDVALLAMVAAAMALCGWRPGRTLLLVGLSMAGVAVADGVYVYQAAADVYAEGSLLDTLWVASALLLAAAAWSPPEPRRAARGARAGAAVVLPVAAAALAAIAILSVDHFHRLDGVGVGLAAAALVVVAIRATLAFRENERLLVRLTRDAMTDPLTGLGNRRRLIRDLDELLQGPPPERARLLILLDLDGFKGYNDAFGHPAGDALLQRLGARLAAGCRESAAYRLGGDEFCVLAPVDPARPDAQLDAAVAALAEEGEGFEIRASVGAVFLPDDAADTSAALREADRRLYANKRGRRASADTQTQDVLAQAIQERAPELSVHSDDVVDLAVAVARRLGLRGPDLEDVARAAALHDVGKLAIPDEVLAKPGPLDDGEWELMRTHTLIGERILAAAPALRAAARLVRHSHERWDGRGYPDGLAGEQIPLGARIVAACDAFDAITADRCYRAARSEDEAMAEIARCSGTQFDPRVARALREVVGDRPRAASRPSAGV